MGRSTGLLPSRLRQSSRAASCLGLHLDFDGDLDWILYSGGQNLLVENAAVPRSLGAVFGMPVEILPKRERGYHVLRTFLGSGFRGSDSHFDAFDGKRYVGVPARDDDPF